MHTKLPPGREQSFCSEKYPYPLAIHSINISAPQSTSSSGGLVAKPFSRGAAGMAVNMAQAKYEKEFSIARDEIHQCF